MPKSCPLCRLAVEAPIVHRGGGDLVWSRGGGERSTALLHGRDNGSRRLVKTGLSVHLSVFLGRAAFRAFENPVECLLVMVTGFHGYIDDIHVCAQQKIGGIIHAE